MELTILQWKLLWIIIIKHVFTSLVLERLLQASLHCMTVSIQSQQYEYDPLP